MTGFYNTNLPPHLRVLKDEIEGYARDYGLDFYETIFEVVDADDLNEIAAYGGFPTRYPHWSFGMQYEELKKGYEYGLSKIYEMVINNDPCYAYLMRCNHTVDQKLVMAHVYGHCDFFKNNAYFGHTTRKMMDEIANHARPHPPVRRAVRRGRGRGVHGQVHVHRRPDRHPLGRHQAARRPLEVRLRPDRHGRGRRTRTRRPRFKAKGVHGRLHQPAGRAEGRGRRAEEGSRTSAVAAASRSGPRRTCCCS